MALLLCLECWPPDNHGHMSLLCPCPGQRAQPQLTLPTPAGMLTKSLYSSWLQGVPATTWFLPSPVCALPWAPSYGAASMGGSFQLFSLLASLVCSHLPASRCFNAWIPQACFVCWAGNHWLNYSRSNCWASETKRISHTAILFWFFFSSKKLILLIQKHM